MGHGKVSKRREKFRRSKVGGETVLKRDASPGKTFKEASRVSARKDNGPCPRPKKRGQIWRGSGVPLT